MNLEADRVLFAEAARGAGAVREVDRVFAIIAAAYQEPHRAYHALSHIEHGVALLASLEGMQQKPAQVAFAYFFHDLVYKTTPLADNEAESAKLLVSLGREMGIPEDALQRMSVMVLATKRHELPPATARGADVDLETLLDVDLSILGSDARTYATFERDVRTEYAWVPELLYASGRKKALAHFLDRPAIYHRPELAERWEAAARNNLTQVLRLLEGEADVRGISADEEGLFTTYKGRLEHACAWADVSSVVVEPKARDRHVLRIHVASSEKPFAELALDHAANTVVAQKVRELPGYDVAVERATRASHERRVVFERG